MTPWRRRDVRPVSPSPRSASRPGSGSRSSRSIEQGDFSPCGGDFYARGHIRSIAEVVGIDPVPLIREYDEEHGPPGSMRAAQIFEPATPIKIREPRPTCTSAGCSPSRCSRSIGFGAYHLVSTHGTHSTAAGTDGHRAAGGDGLTADGRRPAVTATRPRRPEGRGGDQADRHLRLLGRADNSPTGQQLYQGIIPAGTDNDLDEKKPVSHGDRQPAGDHADRERQAASR